MKIRKTTRRYEEWLSNYTPLIQADIELKHARMAQSPFSFLRATYYRWAQLWPKVCRDLAAAPAVLGVGDLHVENFGTWRDIEGRLIWGINDFDEAFPASYANDLVRLAASAHLAIAENHLSVSRMEASEAILSGYLHELKRGGTPFVLAEEHQWLRDLALNQLRDPVHFWEKMDGLAVIKGRVPADALTGLQKMMPDPDLECRVAHRIAGLGSLGRQRFVATAAWRGGKVAREAKALAPSACVWAQERKKSNGILYQKILDQSVRCLDPFVRLKGRWIVRRLAPDCSRIELSSLPRGRDEARLLYSMGRETANIHLGNRKAIGDIKRHLRKQRHDWLHGAASDMVKAMLGDWKEWKDQVTR